MACVGYKCFICPHDCFRLRYRPGFSLLPGKYMLPHGNFFSIPGQGMDELLNIVFRSGAHRTILIMFIITVAATVIIYLLERWFQQKKADDEDRLAMLARKQGKSEYDIFVEAAAGWGISGERIEQDFNDYLLRSIIPHYVRYFLRQQFKNSGD